MIKYLLVISCISIILHLESNGQITQVDTIFTESYMKRSTDFASMTFGGDGLILTEGRLDTKGKNIALPSQFSTRLTIGGLHYWGHADFYVHFPIGINLGKDPISSKDYTNMEHVECGFKYFPLAPTDNDILETYKEYEGDNLGYKYLP